MSGVIVPRGLAAKGQCTGLTELMFYNGPNKMIYAHAKTVCIGCPVKEECLTFALDECIDEGVWGGTSERERKRMRSVRS